MWWRRLDHGDGLNGKLRVGLQPLSGNGLDARTPVDVRLNAALRNGGWTDRRLNDRDGVFDHQPDSAVAIWLGLRYLKQPEVNTTLRANAELLAGAG